MCNYNGTRITRAEFIRLKQIEKDIRHLNSLVNRPLQSGFDYADWPVVKPNAAGTDFDLVPMQWGVLPSYVRNMAGAQRFRNGYKDEKGFHPGLTTLNAKGEEMLAPGKMFREAALQRRCLVLSSGFYEWRHLPQIGKKGQPLKATSKIPYHITVKEKEYFFMAGIWQDWTDKDTGETIPTFAIVTTAANELMDQVHNAKKRMPVILTEELAWEWLQPGLTEQRIQEIATFQISCKEMAAYTIAKDFREAHDPVAPFKYDDVPDLVF